ncbi:MAG: iron ABC transporter permease [Candidatus Methanomethylophilaceae archaeon]|nr:iron ABC transporter permease [Candidatus Methanomethylophilaceae archaeon]
MKFVSDIKQDVLLSDGVKDSVDSWTDDISDDEMFSDTVSRYAKSVRVRIAMIVLLIVVALFAAIYSIQSGPLCGDMIQTIQILWDYMLGQADLDDSVVHWTLYATPPVLGALLGGAGLAICGAVMQSVLRNPMADPYTTGISSGASFGAALAIASGSILVQISSLTVLLAFAFSMIPVLVILLISKMTNASPITIIMTGIGIMYVFNAATSIIRLVAGGTAMSALDNWLMGDVQLVQWNDLPVMAVITVIGVIVSMYLASRINVLSTGDENAKAMGINADKLRIICLILTAVVSAGIISFTGLIGFVGLVCPHIIRMFIGADNRYLIPASAAFGSALMVVAHLVGKMVIAPTLVPVGIIMACVGGPVFIWLVIRKNKSTW